jgi:hypothetical protein
LNGNIKKYIKNQNIVEIYSISRDNFEYNDFILGVIIKQIGKYIFVKTLDDSALVDSYTLILIEDISKIATNTYYTNVFAQYVCINKQKDIYDPFNLYEQSLLFKGLNLSEIITYCLKRRRVLSICTNMDDEVHKGEIITFNNFHIALNEKKYEQIFGNYSRTKNTVIDLNNVTAIDILSKENNLYEEYLEKENRK